MTLWKTPDIQPDVFRSHLIIVDYEARGHTEPMLSTQYASLTADRYVNRWCYLDDLMAAADRAESLQVELEETKKALLRDFETRNDCLIKVLESYLNFAGLVRAYPNVPALPTFRAGNIIYDWSPVLEFMKNGRTDRALERLKAIEPDQICPKCGEKMTETMLLSLPPKTQYKCWKCGCAETKGNK